MDKNSTMTHEQTVDEMQVLGNTHQPSSGVISLFLKWNQGGLVVTLIGLVVALGITKPIFFSPPNLAVVGVSIAVLGIISIVQTALMCTGGIDLSVGSLAALTTMIVAIVLTTTHNAFLAIVAAIVCGSIGGLLNGVLSTMVNINPLITTLGTWSIFSALALIINNGQSKWFNSPAISSLATGHILGIPVPIVIFVIVGIFVWAVLKYTVPGRTLFLIGGNEEASRLAGISLQKYKMLMYIISGISAGIGGLVLAARLSSGQPLAASTLNLEVVTAVVLGGTSLNGGTGFVSGTVLAVLLFGVLDDSFVLWSIPSFYQGLAQGCLLLLALGLDQLRNKISMNRGREHAK